LKRKANWCVDCYVERYRERSAARAKANKSG
jgi:hypothetical protein